MARIPESDDELLDIYHGTVPLPPGWVRGKYATRFAPLTEKYSLDLSEPTGLQPTSAARNGVAGQQAENWRLFREKLVGEWGPLAERCTVPIWQEAEGVTWPVGTGTLFRVADVSFLVSASHVLRHVGPNPPDLCILSGGRRGTGYKAPLCGRTVGNEQLDVAVTEVPASEAAELVGVTFLNVHQADRRNIRPSGGVFAYAGFPAERSARLNEPPGSQFAVGLMASLTRPYPGDSAAVPDYDPAVHVLLWNPPFGEKLDGTQFRTPDPAGLSGCSLWQLYCPEGWVQHWSIHTAVVVGVQTHADRDLGYIRGTRWWVVDQLIREGWPHLAPALSLEVPHPAAV